ncbi:MAG: hypothetical protein ABEK02_03595 [Haloquadratum sp.]
MKLLSRLQTAIGIGGAALVVAVVVDPGLLPIPATLPNAALPGVTDIRYAVTAVLALATLAFAFVHQVRRSTAGGDVDPLVTEPPEEITGRATGYPRPEVDESFRRLAEGSAEREAVEAVADDLRETAITLYDVAHGCGRAEATEAVDAGQWTEDRRAATFVARDPDPLPLRSRLWDYVRSEDAAHRRARHAVEALESLTADETAPEDDDE